MTTNKSFHASTLKDESIIRRPGEGQTLNMDGVSTTFKITSKDSNDHFGIYEITIAPGKTGAAPHYHRHMDETFFIIKGTLTIQLSGREENVSAGSVVYVPRLTPHGFRNNTGEMVKLILLFNPAYDREDFFKGLYEIMAEDPVDPEKFLELYKKYDSYPVNAADMRLM